MGLGLSTNFLADLLVQETARFGIERLVRLALHENARVSIANHTLLVFQ